VERAVMVSSSNPSDLAISMYYSFQSSSCLFFVLEFCPGGDLFSLLQNHGNLSASHTRRYTCDIVLGIEMLHNLGIIHRDLKPDNLLIATDGKLKLCDFGLSKLRDASEKWWAEPPVEAGGPRPGGRLRSGSGPNSHSQPEEEQRPATHRPSISGLKEGSPLGISTTPSPSTVRRMSAPAIQLDIGSSALEGAVLVGTPDYMAPELLRGEASTHGKGVDWWAIGCLVYEMLIGIPPFNGPTQEAVFDNITRGEVPWDDEDGWIKDCNVPPEAQALVMELLTADPNTRLGSLGGAADVKCKPFFSSVDWMTVRDSPPPWCPPLPATPRPQEGEKKALADLVADANISSCQNSQEIAGFYPFSHASQLALFTGGKAKRFSERNRRLQNSSDTQ